MESSVAKAESARRLLYEWTARRGEAASGRTGFIRGSRASFAYLFLVGALRESGRSRSPCCCRCRSACSAPLAALILSGLDNNIFAQIGIVVLIALAAKNAILIVEFAMDERAGGRDIVTAPPPPRRCAFAP